MLNKQLTKEEALALYESNVWREWSPLKLAVAQITQNRLFCDFSSFHEAVEKSLNRPVFTHEFVNKDSLLQELLGEKNSPTQTEIITDFKEMFGDRAIIAQ